VATFGPVLQRTLKRPYLGGDVGAPFLDRLEAGLGASDRLGFALDFVFGFVEVDLEAQGLRYIPWRVANHLDAVALGSLK
jgi:hypothetical protein